MPRDRAKPPFPLTASVVRRDSAGAAPSTAAASDTEALATTVWALVRGLAFLHLGGNLGTSVLALFAASPAIQATMAAD